MDTPPPPDEIRDELHRWIDRLPDAVLVALWRFVWFWVTNRPPRGS